VGQPRLLSDCHNGGVSPQPLDRLTERLERAAAELRSGSLAPDEAATLVDECARLAGEASVELDRQVRAGESDAVGNGQLALES
jgi:hypothetical protein